MKVLVSLLLLLLLQILLISSQVFNRYDSNHNIIVNNCNSSSSISIINHIRHAIQTADKDVYLSLNHDWLDSILIGNKRSNVRCMTLHELNKMNSVDTNHVDMTKVNEDDEVIEIIYVPVTNATITVTSYTSGYIDTFLTLNPCWIVLQEPDLFNDNDDEIMDKRIKSRLRNKPVIFVRLPTYPYGPTCLLYTHLTRRQFPKSCPGKDDLYYHYLQNYGFGGEISKTIKTFLYNLYSSSSKVYATPRHEGYQFLWANSNNSSKNPCPSNMYKENPLACSFISIASCSVNDRVNEDQDWYDFEIDGNDDGKHKTLQHLGINVNVLKKYRDGPGPAVHNEGRNEYSANVWVTLRTYAFILRPNYRTRSLIRKATRRIKTLSSNGVSKHNYLNHQTRLGVQVKNQCIGIHVRNHDVLSDFRNEIKLDRSLNAHIHAAKNLSIALAINDFFLATDNGTLFKIAPIEYPFYRWQGQSRNIKVKFDTHTTHLSEDEPQKELAALIADFLQMGKCHGIVGASDSSLTLIYQIYNCNNMVRSSCSSFYDIKQLEGQGILSYIGKKARPDTIASFDYPWKD